MACENCRIRESCSNISSHSNIKAISFKEIIEEAELLVHSNRKIEGLISYHEPIVESSINLYRSMQEYEVYENRQ